jgi:hypothetical protein
MGALAPPTQGAQIVQQTTSLPYSLGLVVEGNHYSSYIKNILYDVTCCKTTSSCILKTPKCFQHVISNQLLNQI